MDLRTLHEELEYLNWEGWLPFTLDASFERELRETPCPFCGGYRSQIEARINLQAHKFIAFEGCLQCGAVETV